MTQTEEAVAPEALSPFDTPEYRRSRAAYRLECMFEYFVSIFAGNAFLTNMLLYIGIEDSLIMIISSFISLAFLFQLASLFVVQRIVRVKRFVISFHITSQVLFMLLYLVPFLPVGIENKKAAVIVCMLVAYFAKYLVFSMLYKWGNSFVDPEKRASYSAGKEILSLATGIVLSLLVGYAMDAFTAADHQQAGFLFAAAGMLIFCIADFVCLLLIGKGVPQKTEDRPEPVPFRTVLAKTVGNRDFRHVILLTVLWDVARYFSLGSLGTYRQSELAYTVGIIMVIDNVGHLARILISRPFGRYSDRRSYAKGIELALILAAIAFAFVVVTTPETRLFIIGYSIFYACCFAGLNQNMQNIVYSYVDSRYFVQASAIKNSIGGICGFGATLLGARILKAVQTAGNTVLGVTVYGQQILAAGSVILLVIAVLYTRFVIEKQHVMKQ